MYTCGNDNPEIRQQTKRKLGQQAGRWSGCLPYQLAEFIGQLLDHHTKTLKFLEHADQVLTGEATDHLQVFTRTKKTQRKVSAGKKKQKQSESGQSLSWS